jgi:hypothetical protein
MRAASTPWSGLSRCTCLCYWQELQCHSKAGARQFSAVCLGVRVGVALLAAAVALHRNI